MTPPLTPAEIETLRKIVNGELDREVDYAAIIAANKTLDRLSPPAPEVDEATRIWRGMKAHSNRFDGVIADRYRQGAYDRQAPLEMAYLRTALSELIASKGGEIESLSESLRSEYIKTDDLTRDLECTRIREKNADRMADEMRRAYNGAIGRAEKAEVELATLRAENERLKAVVDATVTFVNEGLRNNGEHLIVVEKKDRSDAHYKLCDVCGKPWQIALAARMCELECKDKSARPATRRERDDGR